MRIVVLGSQTNWHVSDLQRAAAGKCEILAASFSEVASELGSEQSVSCKTLDLAHSDAVLVRSMPVGSLEQVVFRMDALARLAARCVPIVNPPRAIEAAVDKYLTTARLQDAGLLTPRTYACQTAGAATQALEGLGGRAVLKPLFGGEGRGLELLESGPAAGQVFAALQQRGSVIYLQEFIEHQGYDLRLLVIGQQVLGMRRVNNNDWRTNISRGAIAEPLEVSGELARIARTAAAAVGAPLAGVDVLPASDGRLFAIEVNASPGWRALAEVSGRDVAGEILRLLDQQAQSAKSRQRTSPVLTDQSLPK